MVKALNRLCRWNRHRFKARVLPYRYSSCGNYTTDGKSKPNGFICQGIVTNIIYDYAALSGIDPRKDGYSFRIFRLGLITIGHSKSSKKINVGFPRAHDHSSAEEHVSNLPDAENQETGIVVNKTGSSQPIPKTITCLGVTPRVERGQKITVLGNFFASKHKQQQQQQKKTSKALKTATTRTKGKVGNTDDDGSLIAQAGTNGDGTDLIMFDELGLGVEYAINTDDDFSVKKCEIGNIDYELVNIASFANQVGLKSLIEAKRHFGNDFSYLDGIPHVENNDNIQMKIAEQNYCQKLQEISGFGEKTSRNLWNCILKLQEIYPRHELISYNISKANILCQVIRVMQQRGKYFYSLLVKVLECDNSGLINTTYTTANLSIRKFPPHLTDEGMIEFLKENNILHVRGEINGLNTPNNAVICGYGQIVFSSDLEKFEKVKEKIENIKSKRIAKATKILKKLQGLPFPTEIKISGEESDSEAEEDIDSEDSSGEDELVNVRSFWDIPHFPSVVYDGEIESHCIRGESDYVVKYIQEYVNHLQSNGGKRTNQLTGKVKKSKKRRSETTEAAIEYVDSDGDRCKKWIELRNKKKLLYFDKNNQILLPAKDLLFQYNLGPSLSEYISAIEMNNLEKVSDCLKSHFFNNNCDLIENNLDIQNTYKIEVVQSAHDALEQFIQSYKKTPATPVKSVESTLLFELLLSYDKSIVNNNENINENNSFNEKCGIGKDILCFDTEFFGGGKQGKGEDSLRKLERCYELGYGYNCDSSVKSKACLIKHPKYTYIQRFNRNTIGSHLPYDRNSETLNEMQTAFLQYCVAPDKAWNDLMDVVIKNDSKYLIHYYCPKDEDFLKCMADYAVNNKKKGGPSDVQNKYDHFKNSVMFIDASNLFVKLFPNAICHKLEYLAKTLVGEEFGTLGLRSHSAADDAHALLLILDYIQKQFRKHDL